MRTEIAMPDQFHRLCLQTLHISQRWHFNILPEMCHIPICPPPALKSFPFGKTHTKEGTNKQTHTHPNIFTNAQMLHLFALQLLILPPHPSFNLFTNFYIFFLVFAWLFFFPSSSVSLSFPTPEDWPVPCEGSSSLSRNPAVCLLLLFIFFFYYYMKREEENKLKWR